MKLAGRPKPGGPFRTLTPAHYFARHVHNVKKHCWTDPKCLRQTFFLLFLFYFFLYIFIFFACVLSASCNHVFSVRIPQTRTAIILTSIPWFLFFGNSGLGHHASQLNFWIQSRKTHLGKKTNKQTKSVSHFDIKGAAKKKKQKHSQPSMRQMSLSDGFFTGCDSDCSKSKQTIKFWAVPRLFLLPHLTKC